MSRTSPFVLRIAVLGALYLVQGLPFGLQATALPVLLRRLDAPLELIGFAGALVLPWALKVLWAPWVEGYWIRSFGKRRTWIVPLQIALGACAIAAAFVDPRKDLPTLLALIFAMNLAAATMDVAVDGWAVELLAPDELGPGNGAQVVGYKLGMLTTGGLLLAVLSDIGWFGYHLAAATLIGATTLLVIAIGERTAPALQSTEGVREVVRAIVQATRRPGALWILLFIGTYKLGESAADAMFKPFLVDAGFTDAQIGAWVGVYGTIASVLGSVAGALIARRLPIVSAVGLTASLRVIPMLGQFALALTAPVASSVIAVSIGEHFFGGALTTAMFAFMMKQVDPRIGGAHFAAFATIEFLGKAPAGLLSGVLAVHVGYVGVFAVGAALSLAFLTLLAPIRRAAVRSSVGRLPHEGPLPSRNSPSGAQGGGS